MGVAEILLTEGDRARLLRAQDERDGERRYARCRGCSGTIPPRRRINARYCSWGCMNRTKVRARKALLREIELARRAESPRECYVCGRPIAPERRAHALACSRACSSLAYARRRTGRAVAGAVRGKQPGRPPDRIAECDADLVLGRRS